MPSFKSDFRQGLSEVELALAIAQSLKGDKLPNDPEFYRHCIAMLVKTLGHTKASLEKLQGYLVAMNIELKNERSKQSSKIQPDEHGGGTALSAEEIEALLADWPVETTAEQD